VNLSQAHEPSRPLTIQVPYGTSPETWAAETPKHSSMPLSRVPTKRRDPASIGCGVVWPVLVLTSLVGVLSGGITQAGLAELRVALVDGGRSRFRAHVFDAP
jgi:hypothetical protein